MTSVTTQAADAQRLHAIFKDRQAKDPSLTQQRLATLCGWKHQSAAQQYLAGKIPLNFDAIIKFSELLGVSPSNISPTMGARLVKCIANNYPLDDLLTALVELEEAARFAGIEDKKEREAVGAALTKASAAIVKARGQ